jgi:SAM-dependent methyltransferase
MNKHEKLILGSAGQSFSDAITIDMDPKHHPDVVHDLQVTPWPFEDNTFKEIIAHHVIEHFDSLIKPFQELHRICSKDGSIYIEVPHHTAWFARDPEHRIFFSYFSFDGHIQGKKTWITGAKFECLSREITFHKIHRFFFLHKLFNRFPLAYERFFCYLFPAENIKIWLRPKK